MAFMFEELDVCENAEGVSVFDEKTQIRDSAAQTNVLRNLALFVPGHAHKASSGTPGRHGQGAADIVLAEPMGRVYNADAVSLPVAGLRTSLRRARGIRSWRRSCAF